MSWKERTWLDTWEIKFRDPDEPDWVLTNLRDWWSCRHDCGVDDYYGDGDVEKCVHCGASAPEALQGLQQMMRWAGR